MRAIDDVRAKLNRARKHGSELDGAIADFFASQPYVVGTRRDPETRRLVYFASQVSEPPVEIATIAGDVLQGLRGALDHLAYHLVLGNRSSPTTQTCFPIADDEPTYLRERGRKVKGMSTAASTAIDALKPYKGGNDALWRLHKLNNIDKHRVLITVGSAFRSLDIGAHMSALMAKESKKVGMVLPTLSLFLAPNDRSFPLKVGTELFLDAPDAEPNPKLQFRFEVAFEEAEADVTNGQPIVETLSTLAKEVEATIGHLEGYLP